MLIKCTSFSSLSAKPRSLRINWIKRLLSTEISKLSTGSGRKSWRTYLETGGNITGSFAHATRCRSNIGGAYRGHHLEVCRSSPCFSFGGTTALGLNVDHQETHRTKQGQIAIHVADYAVTRLHTNTTTRTSTYKIINRARGELGWMVLVGRRGRCDLRFPLSQGMSSFLPELSTGSGRAGGHTYERIYGIALHLDLTETTIRAEIRRCLRSIAMRVGARDN